MTVLIPYEMLCNGNIAPVGAGLFLSNKTSYLTETQNHEIHCWNAYIALKFGRQLEAQTTIKFQSNWKVLNTDLSPLKLFVILQGGVLGDIEIGPRGPFTNMV